MRIQPLTESSCIVYLGDGIDEEVSARVCRAAERIRRHLGPALLELVPSYASVHVELDLSLLSAADACTALGGLLAGIDADRQPLPAPRRFEIPAYYGQEVAPDLPEVERHTGLSAADIGALHCARPYRVYAIGFAPGFCFLGTTDARLLIPRKASPRRQVPAGSIAIAERQTAVYPAPTPGGWQIIGRTCIDVLALFSDAERPARVGDEVRFVAVTRETFLHAGGVIS